MAQAYLAPASNSMLRSVEFRRRAASSRTGPPEQKRALHEGLAARAGLEDLGACIIARDASNLALRTASYWSIRDSFGVSLAIRLRHSFATGQF
jgi:hypothetical protein